MPDRKAREGGFFRGRIGARRRRGQSDAADASTQPGSDATDLAASAAPAGVPDAPVTSEPPAAEAELPAHSAADMRLPDGQEEAVFVFCRDLLRAPTADEAAADALLAFKQLLAAHDDDSPEAPGADLLLAITRRMAAVSMPDRGSPSERRMAVSASLGAEIQCSCRETAALLSARSNGDIEPRGAAALSNHLAACPECRALDAHFERAEREFRETIAAAVAAAAVVEEAPVPAEVPVEQTLALEQGEAQPQPEPELLPAEPEVESQSEPEVESQSEPESEPEAESQSEPEAESQSEPEPETQAEPKPEEPAASDSLDPQPSVIQRASVMVSLVVLGALGVAAALLAITGVV